MECEPRWLDGYPTSEFRTQASAVIASPFTQEVMQISTHPDQVEAELDELAAFLADESLLPEVRAVCGFQSLEFTHPFADGNGHTGRMLVPAILQGRYTPQTLARFSRELVLGRKKASYQFSLIRNGERTVPEFCHAMLSCLNEAQ